MVGSISQRGGAAVQLIGRVKELTSAMEPILPARQSDFALHTEAKPVHRMRNADAANQSAQARFQLDDGGYTSQ
jgi:hypothetical protein